MLKTYNKRVNIYSAVLLKINLQWVKLFTDIVIFGNIFIAICAVFMTQNTLWFLHIKHTNHTYTYFVFFATLASYNFHWYFTHDNNMHSERINWLNANKNIHLLLLVIGILGIIIFSPFLVQQAVWVLPAIIFTILYSAPKVPIAKFQEFTKYIPGKTLLLAITWTYVTAILPIIIYGFQWNNAATLFVVNNFLLVLPICILFDIRDKETDKQSGLKSIVIAFPTQIIKIIFMCSLALNIITAFILYTFHANLLQTIYLMIPALLTLLLYETAVNTRNDYLYYFILDGLMMLSAILYFITYILLPIKM